jgi:hypothetical protein
MREILGSGAAESVSTQYPSGVTGEPDEDFLLIN